MGHSSDNYEGWSIIQRKLKARVVCYTFCSLCFRQVLKSDDDKTQLQRSCVSARTDHMGVVI